MQLLILAHFSLLFKFKSIAKIMMEVEPQQLSNININFKPLEKNIDSEFVNRGDISFNDLVNFLMSLNEKEPKSLFLHFRKFQKEIK